MLGDGLKLIQNDPAMMADILSNPIKHAVFESMLEFINRGHQLSDLEMFKFVVAHENRKK